MDGKILLAGDNGDERHLLLDLHFVEEGVGHLKFVLASRMVVPICDLFDAWCLSTEQAHREALSRGGRALSATAF